MQTELKMGEELIERWVKWAGGNEPVRVVSGWEEATGRVGV